MLLSFMIVIFWCLVYWVLGAIVLAGVPALRVTVLNLVAFVMGAYPGSLAGWYVSGMIRLGRLEINPVIVSLVGAAAGGTLLVWLKTRFIKTPADTRLL
jgi:hypothetical protein